MRTSLSPSIPPSIHHSGGREPAASPGRDCLASPSLLPLRATPGPARCISAVTPRFLPSKWEAAQGRAGRATMLRLVPG